MIAVIVIGLLVAVALAVEKHRFGYRWRDLLVMPLADEEGDE